MIAGGGGTQKSSWLLLARLLARPVHSRALHWTISVNQHCNTQLVSDQEHWSAEEADADADQLGCCPPHDARQQVPTPSLSKAWINRPASTATPHFTYWWVPFPATGPSRRPWPPMYIHLGHNLASTSIFENWSHGNLHFSSTLYPAYSSLLTSSVRQEEDLLGFALRFVCCLLSCLLLSLQINVLFSWVVFCCVVWLTRR